MSNTEEHFRSLTRLSTRELDGIMAISEGPDLKSLGGWEFAGYNHAAFTQLLGIRKFVKGFFPGGSEGYNIPVIQNGIESPWLHLPHPERPKRFGFYRAAKVDPKARDNRYPRAVLLDYGASPRNFFLKPERVLRDYLVVPDPKDPGLLLGKAYLALGPGRIFSNYFILKKLRKTEWQGS